MPEIPEQCPDCPRSFKSMNAVRLHRQRAHGVVPSPIVPGQRFERLVVIAAQVEGKKDRCIVACDCGTQKVVWTGDLRSGNQRSCGCLKRETSLARSTTHNMTHTPEYKAWVAMKDRVSISEGEKHEWYGERGIKVCDEWLNDFEAFYRHIGPKPSPEYSVDRINNDGNYEPENVRWATPTEQANNRRPRRWGKRPECSLN